jgi:Protein of unknown function, DUF481
MRKVFFLFVLLNSNILFAQDFMADIKQSFSEIPNELKQAKREYLLNTGINILNGTNSSTTIVTNLDIGFVSKKISFFLNNHYLYGKANGIKNFNDFTSDISMTLLSERAIYPVLQMNILRSFSMKKAIQFSLMPSLGFNPSIRKELPLLFTLGLGYEQLNFQNSTLNGLKNFSLMRLNVGFNANQLQLNQLGKLDYNLMYQPILVNFNKFRVLSNLQYAVPVIDKVTFIFNLLYSYENIVPEGTKPHQLITTFGVGFKN